ncbi:OmpA family protein [Saccharospirillum salsuginis]|uniref:OmpA-like domain-containing protein n=1 Tax=Saccharospirillum salsuginis TaxID=418750 RepID=A0A918K579_9GAMM|nr:OmpA family protein [Saccharospirillum salsuginis]GGX49880.1 hypothetical protein GCM10007392_16590 [Saccharospirillum salsuginis]
MTLTHSTLKLSLAAALVAATTPAWSNEEKPGPLWFSLDAGAATALTQDDYQQQIDDAGFDDVTVSAPDTARFTGRLGAGWDFWQRDDSPFTLAAQAEWFSLGPVDLSYSGSIPQSELDDLYDALVGIHPDSGNGLALGVSGRWQGFDADRLRPLSLGGELGANYWWQRFELDDINGDTARTDETDGAGWYGGLLADYRLTPQWSTRAGWRVYGLDSETTQTLTLGLTFRLNTRQPPEPEPVQEPITPESEPAPIPAPIGQPDSFTLDRDSEQTLDVLANDSDPSGLPLRIIWVEGASAGQVQVVDNGLAIHYRHEGGDETSDAFQYWFTNGENEVGPVQVSLTLNPVAPTPSEDQFQVGFNTVSRLDVLANDSDPNAEPLSVSRMTQPQAGTVRRVDDILVYQHDGSTVETLDFDYWVTNGRREAGPVSVNLTVLPEVLTIPITFASMSTEVRSEDQPALDQLATWLNRNPGAIITVIGHTDNDGNPDFNQRLSERRAESVVTYLIEQGIDRNRLTAIGFGDSQPVADNTTPEGRRANRRVEVRLE